MQSPENPRKKWGAATHAIHGRHDDAYLSPTYPIYQTSTFAVDKSRDFEALLDGTAEDAYVYTRYGNPTIENVQEKLAAIHRAEVGFLFSSGMAAVAAAILSQVKAGDTVAAVRPVYGGTYAFIADMLPRAGITSQFITPQQAYEIEKHVPAAKLIYFETPANPTTICIDIAAVVSAAQRIGARTVIDNTFASPINTLPLEWGVDLVLESATKFLGGHSDIIAGVVLGGADHAEALHHQLILYGGCASPLEAFLLDRSLKTLKMRVQTQNENALKIAQFFEAEPSVQRVYYPFLPSHPDHDVARKQMAGGGGLMALDLGSVEAAIAFADALEIVVNAVSLGSVESLVTIPALSTHAKVDEAERQLARVTPGTVRLSVGAEDYDDLLADLKQALAKAQRVPSQPA
jgi:methionine-gamma-lyase